MIRCQQIAGHGCIRDIHLVKVLHISPYLYRNCRTQILLADCLQLSIDPGKLQILTSIASVQQKYSITLKQLPVILRKYGFHCVDALHPTIRIQTLHTCSLQ